MEKQKRSVLQARAAGRASASADEVSEALAGRPAAPDLAVPAPPLAGRGSAMWSTNLTEVLSGKQSGFRTTCG